ncbi:MAG: hypothetical protein V3T14_06530 [Myxococcota bacterium]
MSEVKSICPRCNANQTVSKPVGGRHVLGLFVLAALPLVADYWILSISIAMVALLRSYYWFRYRGMHSCGWCRHRFKVGAEGVSR